MFLRRNRRKANGETYEYWTLAETVRTARGPRQKVVATLGKAPGLERKSRRRWEDIVDLLDGREPARQLELGESAEEEESGDWTEVDLRSLQVERVREFGAVYLGLSLWRRLGLHTLLEELIAPGKEKVPWGGGRLYSGHRPVLREQERVGGGGTVVSG